MGFSVSAATAIVFAGLILTISVMAGVVFRTFEDLTDAALDVSETEFDRARTRIEIANSSYNATSVFVNVTNTGEITLKTTFVDVLFNGTIRTENITLRKVEGTSSTVWGVHEVLYMEVDYATANNFTRIRLITENGVSGSKVMK